MRYKTVAILVMGIIFSYSPHCFSKPNIKKISEEISLHQNIGISSDYHMRYAGKTENKVSLLYDAFLNKGPLSIKLFTTVPEFFGLGNVSGIWDKNGELVSVFSESSLSINKLSGKNLVLGPLEEWYISSNYNFNLTPHGYGYQEFFTGLKTDIETNSDMDLSLALYAKRQWQNYGQSNENTWDGYRFNLTYAFPIQLLSSQNRRVSYFSYTNFDWGSGPAENLSSYSRSIKPNQMTSNHCVSINYDHWYYSLSAQYFHNGGHSSNGEESDGWGYLMKMGYSF
jgi:nucleoside-specific channel-forming protein